MFAATAAVQIDPHLSGRDRWTWWLVLAPLLAILVQAGVYWLLARRWVGHGTMSATLARVYQGFAVLDLLLLAIALIALGMAGLPLWPGLGFLAVWIFGVLEFINYAVVRLAYPAADWSTQVTRWRTPRLAADVRAGLAASPRRS